MAFELDRKTTALATLGLIAAAICLLYAVGRTPWGTAPDPGL